MKKKNVQKIINNIRNLTPLPLRQRVGPLVGYFAYLFEIYLRHGSYTPQVLSIQDSLDQIVEHNLSVIRFGDGEMSLIDGTPLAFQNTNAELAEKLKVVLHADSPGLLICVPPIFKKINHFTRQSFWFTIHHLFRYRHVWLEELSLKQIYGNAFITRPYLSFENKSQSELCFKKLFLVWKNKKVVLIEGSKSRLGIGNDLFKNVASLKRILCPAENAYSKYETIKNEATKLSKDTLILISLGPTAKVLAYDLFCLGYRVIDIGHIDMEYEMFLRKQNRIVKVDYKYFNEISERNPAECSDPIYMDQILATIE